MSLLRIPVWPESRQGEAPMTFLHGEAGWYLWLLHKQGADLSRVERDMMLLYNNGDLKSYPQDLKPETGMYVCTLSQNKIIRGLVLNKYKNVVPEAGSVHLLDVDGGRVLNVSITNLKVLPTFASKAAARAVRCDLGLDCSERFSWPTQLDDMLKRSLAGGELLVQFESERPGSIPTVSVTARLWNPSAGATIDFRDWLVQFFGPHLEINALNDYLPTLIVSETSVESIGAEALSPDPVSPRPPENLMGPRPEPRLTSSGFPSVPAGFHPLSFITNNLVPGFGYPMPAWPWTNNTNSPPLNKMPQFQSAAPINFALNNRLQAMNQRTMQDEPPRMPVDGDVQLCEQLEKTMISNEERRHRSESPVLTVESVKEAIAPSVSPSREVEETAKSKRKIDSLEKNDTNHVEASLNNNDVSSYNMENSAERAEMTPRLKEKADETSPQTMEINPKHVETNGLPKTTRDIEHPLTELKRNWKNGAIIHVIISHVVSPDLFAAVIAEDASLAYHLQKEMMENYSDSKPLPVLTKEAVEELVGNFCVCFDEAERFWFRAEVQEWYFHKSDKPVNVWCLDFGGFYDVPLKWIRPLEGECALESPVLSVFFSMHNVRPRQPPLVYDWPEDHRLEIQNILRIDQQYWLRVEEPSRGGVWPVSVFNDRACKTPCLNDVLVEKKLAFYRKSLPDLKQPSVESVMGRTEWNPMAEDYSRGRNMNADDEDACLAVSGYKPTSEANVCRFFQAKGSCRKGLNCRQKHIRLREGGWTLEKEYVYTKAFHELELPADGSVVNIHVTRFMNVHHFFCVLVPDKVLPSEENYQMLLQRLNDPSVNSSLEVLTIAPALGQLVIARHKLKNYWFRGRVIESHVEDDSIFEVLDVDMGTQKWLHMQDMRQMNPTYLYLPFQAIECYLADVAPVKKDQDFAKKGLETARELVKNVVIKARVVGRNIDDALRVKLTTNDGQDLASILSRRGFITETTTRITPNHVVRYIPG